ncbi:hypothetical protein G9A89_003911 [Geosiphon pyriformis]|nr:hypothetical protein G9A89_003911 [Geosiphon pyriformis]
MRCKSCGSTDIDTETSSGETACKACGWVIDEGRIVSEITFGDSASGAAVPQGTFVGSDQSMYSFLVSEFLLSMFTHISRINGPYRKDSEPREVTLRNARAKIENIGSTLHLNGKLKDAAQRIFNLAAKDYNFIQGRSLSIVAAACVYMACRMKAAEIMLIDLADVLQTSVFTIGATFLKLRRELNLDRNNKVPLVDPSLYITRFAHMLDFGDDTPVVVKDALRLVQRMKRDWMVTGRRPGGICGACLLLAARMNNYHRSMREIISVVKIADVTVKKRLNEFKATPSSQLTVNDFREVKIPECCDPPAFTKARKLEQSLKPQSESLYPTSSIDLEELGPISEDEGNVVEEGIEIEERLEEDQVEEQLEEDQIEERLEENKIEEQLEEDQVEERLEEEQVEERSVFEEENEIEEQMLVEENFLVEQSILEEDDLTQNNIGQSHMGSPDLSQNEELEESSLQDGNESSTKRKRVAGEDGGDEDIESVVTATNSNGYDDMDEEETEIANEMSSYLQDDELNQAAEEMEGKLSKICLLTLQNLETIRQRRMSLFKPDDELGSDLDDDEIINVILTEQEIEIKTRIWWKENGQFMKELREKQIRAAQNQSGRTKRKRNKKAKPNEQEEFSSPAEAAKKMLTEKRLSKKINYDVLDSLFEDTFSNKLNNINIPSSVLGQDAKSLDAVAHDPSRNLATFKLDENSGIDEPVKKTNYYREPEPEMSEFEKERRRLGFAHDPDPYDEPYSDYDEN